MMHEANPKIYSVFVFILEVSCKFTCIPLCELFIHAHFKIGGGVWGSSRWAHGSIYINANITSSINMSVSKSQLRSCFLDVWGWLIVTQTCVG